MPARPTTRALLVGINRYTKLPDANQLQGCVNDTALVRGLLTSKQFGVALQDIRLLHDDRATKDAVMARLRQLVQSTGPGDLAVFHFSGHGALITRRDSSGALLDHASEILCLTDIPASIDDPNAYVTDSELTTLLKGLHPEASFLAIMDACHAGAANLTGRTQPGRMARTLVPPADVAHRDAARRARAGDVDYTHRLFGRSSRTVNARVMTLTACLPDQFATDVPVTISGSPGFAGAFTHQLCASLSAKPNQTYQDILNTVGAELATAGIAQTPEFAPVVLATAAALKPVSARVRLSDAVTIKTMHGGMAIASPALSAGLSVVAPTDPKYQQLFSALRSADFVIQPPVAINDTVGTGAPSALAAGSVSLDVPEGYDALLLELRDGIAVWHKPVQVQTGRAQPATSLAAAAPAAVQPGHSQVTFTYRALSSPPMAPAGARGIGGVIGRVFHAVLHPIETVTAAALHAAEGLAFHEGLDLYASTGFAPVKQNPVTSDIGAIQPGGVLLFIHGVLSSVDGCFDKPLVVGALPLLGQQYTLLGYNHLSATVANEAIAQQCHQRLSACVPDGTPIHIIAHSQGAAIARQLACLRPIERIIACGGPLEGTNLANHLEKIVTVTAALDIPVVSFVMSLLKFIDDPEVIPGFLELAVDSDFIKGLDANEPRTAAYYCVRSNFAPDPNDSVFVKLVEEVDSWALFSSAGNDLVIDTANMEPATSFKVANQMLFTPDQHVKHTDYFTRPETIAFIQSALT